MDTQQQSITTWHDDHLAAAAAQGGRQAAEVLVGRYLGRVFGLALRMTGNHADAEDAAQEAMLRAMRSLPSYRTEGTFDRWILKIAANVCLDLLRRRKRFRVDGNSQQHLDGLAAPPPDPAEQRAADRLAMVAGLLDRLGETQRAVFTLFHYQGRSLREVAELMDMPEGTVRSSLHRARARLREMILPVEQRCER